MQKTALVVDNDFFFVEFLGELLEKRDYKVIKAYDGKEGISKIETENIDLMFADIVMPKIDGPELIKFVRMKYKENCFPIVAVSGIIIEHLGSLDKIGADYYIAKGPIEKMAVMFNEFMDSIESNATLPNVISNIIESGTIFPRRESVDLIDSLHFQKSIIQCIGIGVIILDSDIRIMEVNPIAARILNKSYHELLNRPIISIFSDDEKQKLINALKEVVHNKELDKTIFIAAIDSNKIKVIVSQLIVADNKVGWILALEDYYKWEEQV
ncbi:MAG: response regulator [Proteobacteria bacterium]|nr:response regulator [Pseudomonadota bacterium]MBU1712333.1 response regulator [Pseudomonadota bacterium]